MKRSNSTTLRSVVLLALVLSFALVAAPVSAWEEDHAQLVSAVLDGNGSPADLDVSDFLRKARESADFMQPGAEIAGPEVVGVSEWTNGLADILSTYLFELYGEKLEAMGPSWVSDTVRDLRSTAGKLALLSWSVQTADASETHESVAIFDANGTLLVDTTLIHWLSSAEAHDDEVAEEEQGGGAVVTSLRSETVTKSWTFGNCCGTVDLKYTASLTADVAPYITSATNDASYRMVGSVSTARTGGTWFWPVADPQIYFGTGGSLHAFYSSAVGTPWQSPITVNHTSDGFQPGSYAVSGSDGAGSFSVSASVSVAGAGLSASLSGGGPMILKGTSSTNRTIYLGNVLYTDSAFLRYRGNFRSGGNFTVSQCLVRTGSGAGETGSIRPSIPAYMAHEGVGVLSLTGRHIGTLDPSVSYVRGDHILQPSYTVNADRTQVEIGEEIRVTVTVRNNSNVVELKNGTVTLDTGALNGNFVLRSASSVDYGRVVVRGSKQTTFVLEALTAGLVNVQAEIDGAWGSPVPPGVRYGKNVGLTAPIEVTNPDPVFLRADANGDGIVNIADPIFVANFLVGISAATEPPCMAAADGNGDSRLNIADPSFIANFVFGTGVGSPPPAPYPSCDAFAVDAMSCEDQNGCTD